MNKASVRATIAALERVAKPDYNGADATSAARSGYWTRYELRVDPAGVLPPSERLRKAKALWQADMLRGKLGKAKGSGRSPTK